jgi:hypothetical protein
MTERRLSYGHRVHAAEPEPRHYLSACVRPDVWVEIQRLTKEHGLSISGAAHHLMRIGAGLPPLYPLNQQSSDG